MVTGGTITNSVEPSPESFNVTGGGAYAIGSDAVFKLLTDATYPWGPYSSVRSRSGTLSRTALTGKYTLDVGALDVVGDVALTFTAAP